MEKTDWQQKGAGHRGRLRDRYLERGLESLSDTEVIEMLLSFGTPRSDCKEQARALLSHFGSLAAVVEAPISALRQIKGVGEKNCFSLSFIQAVSRRYLQDRLRGKRYLHSAKDVHDYLEHALRGLKREVFSVVYLDSSHAILDTEIIAEGTINVNTVYPRELIIRALQQNAAALIIAHNHPSGSLQPSKQDIALTRSLALLCSLMHIQLLDHILIGSGIYSFADGGLMATINHDCLKLRESMRGDG